MKKLIAAAALLMALATGAATTAEAAATLNSRSGQGIELNGLGLNGLGLNGLGLNGLGLNGLGLNGASAAGQKLLINTCKPNEHLVHCAPRPGLRIRAIVLPAPAAKPASR